MSSSLAPAVLGAKTTPQLNSFPAQFPTEITKNIIFFAVEPSTRRGANIIATCRLFKLLGSHHLYEELRFLSCESFQKFNKNIYCEGDEKEKQLELFKSVRVFQGGDISYESYPVFSLKLFPNLKVLDIHPSMFKTPEQLPSLLNGLTASLDELSLSSVVPLKHHDPPVEQLMEFWSLLLPLSQIQPLSLLLNIKTLRMDHMEISELFTPAAELEGIYNFSFANLTSLQSLTVVVVEDGETIDHKRDQRADYTYDVFRDKLPSSCERLVFVSTISAFPEWLLEKVKKTFASASVETSFEISSAKVLSRSSDKTEDEEFDVDEGDESGELSE